MIKTSRQLKDLIRNLAKENSADAQILMRNYMMERFLERVSVSPYRDSFILKGGMLITAMVGIAARSTMDIDASFKNWKLDKDSVENFAYIVGSIPLDDGISFSLIKVGEIMEEAEYSGFRISLMADFDGSRIPVKIDISTGDAITPKEVGFDLKLMFEERSIHIMTYTLETVLAEKLETIISRSTANTRMRDFYDIHILSKIYGQTLNRGIFATALDATVAKRGSKEQLKGAFATFTEIENSLDMQKLWEAYRVHFS